MDAGVQTLVMGVSAFLGLLFAALAFMNFRNFKKRSGLLKRAQEMTGSVNGRVSELVTVRRSNRSFRWKNEYPVVSYQVNGKEYTVSLDFAEKRKGSYSLGETYRVNYVPSDPSCCGGVPQATGEQPRKGSGRDGGALSVPVQYCVFPSHSIRPRT